MYSRVYQATMCKNKHRTGEPVSLESWVACPSPIPTRGVKLPLSPLRGEDTPGYAPHPGQLAPPPGGEATLA